MKIFYIISWFTIISALALLTLLGYWYFYPYKLIEFKSPYPVTNKVVKTGDYLEYKIEFCKYTNDLPIVSKYFVDGIIYSIPSELAIDNPIGCKTNIVKLYVPKNLPPGNYIVKTIYLYHVNPIREISFISNTENFEVIK